MCSKMVTTQKRSTPHPTRFSVGCPLTTAGMGCGASVSHADDPAQHGSPAQDGSRKGTPAQDGPRKGSAHSISASTGAIVATATVRGTNSGATAAVPATPSPPSYEHLPRAPRLQSSPSFRLKKGGSRGMWYESFLLSDPRQHLVDYFRAGDERGPFGYLREQGLRPTGPPSHYFAVWRPTSMTAIRKLFLGAARGKGMNIKGKSAQAGPLAGFVPFLQIHEEAHKLHVGISPPEARTRIFYKMASVGSEHRRHRCVRGGAGRLWARCARAAAVGGVRGAAAH